MPSLTIQASAKINLHLDVGPRRKDGYHSLSTLFQEISLADTLRFESTDGPLKLSSATGGVPLGKENIVIRALAMLRRRLGVSQGMKVRLDKKIPMGAGLGGGSSDAAAALRAGWILWKKRRGVPRVLFDCARKLGADVPFFLVGGTARGKGIGDILTRVRSSRRRWLVLVYPRVRVSTKEAYRLLDESRLPSPRPSPFRERIGVRANRRFNSFEPVILKKYPRIAAAKKNLVELGCADVMMSGSGSTIYGFAKNCRRAKRIARCLKRPSWEVFVAHTM